MSAFVADGLLPTHCGNSPVPSFSAVMRTDVIIEADVSVDGTKRWELVHRGDGFFVYSEDSFRSEDLREFGAGIEEYWSPTHFSGLFETAEEAKADALRQLPWLKQVKTAA
ncbi:hypothetical protein [Sphingosinicella sp. LY1275]|uniref:hypothetical protein n=1 Tax=Sphingosinicella sp. LY1275 TaxID=3095379 RepID=UPI002ADEA77C|nr:hypothetical protein [Sphingosinicella sp. LY1275]MEA1013707.1 hypothetical protein [Sphingosinicella sp. LY1275]